MANRAVLAWIAVPASQGTHALGVSFGGRSLAVHGNAAGRCVVD
jgi:hypothetical protein